MKERTLRDQCIFILCIVSMMTALPLVLGAQSGNPMEGLDTEFLAFLHFGTAWRMISGVFKVIAWIFVISTVAANILCGWSRSTEDKLIALMPGALGYLGSVVIIGGAMNLHESVEGMVILQAVAIFSLLYQMFALFWHHAFKQ